MRELITVLPWVIPSVAIAIGLGIALARPLARHLRSSELLAFGFILSLGLIIGATIPPDNPSTPAPLAPFGACDLSRSGLASIRTYLRINEVSLNVLLFVPLGLVVGLLPTPPSRWRLVVLVLLMPGVIEITQAAVPALLRGCQSGDVIDNILGIVIGMAMGRLLSARR